MLRDDEDLRGGVWRGGGQHCSQGVGYRRNVPWRRDRSEDSEDVQNGTFTQAFIDKGRLSPLLESIPVRVILDDTCALLGAAAFAEARASEISGISERAASIHTS